MAMSKMTIVPQQVTVGSEIWDTQEIEALKTLFSGRVAVEMGKREIRNNSIIQKALKCGAVVSQFVQAGDEAILYIAQSGLDLVGTLT